MNSQNRIPDADAPPSDGKNRITGLILFMAVVAVTVIINLPYQVVSLDGRWMGVVEVAGRAEPNEYVTTPVMAGWPFNYQIGYSTDGKLQNRYYSLLHLGLNVLLGLGAATAAYGFVQWRHRRLRMSQGRWLNRWMMDASIALVILIVPGSIVAYQYWQFRQHKDLTNQVARYGNTYLSCWVPEPIVSYVPEGLKKLMLRVRRISISSLKDKEEIEAKIRELPTLVGLSVLRDGVQHESLQRLQQNVHFSQLTLSKTKLDSGQVRAIGKLPWLFDLVLRDTNLNPAMLEILTDLPLKSVDLRQSTMALVDLGKPNWSQTVIRMNLSRPRAGKGDSLVVKDWPRLKHLAVTRFVIEHNETPLNIELADLPALESLQIDRMQKHQLTIRNVPRLASIDSGIGQFGYMLDPDNYVPGQTWLSGLKIESAPSLRELECFVRDLESISVRDTPNLKHFSLGAYLVSLLGTQRPQPVDPERCQQWIEIIGNQDGPSTVDLHSLPLGGLDLSPLAKNQRIRNLNLDGCGVDFQQIQTIAGMTQLETLNIRTCQLEQDELAWLLQRFVQLKSLVVDGSSLVNVELGDPLRLKQLTINRLDDLNTLRLVDVPDLRTNLRLVHAPRELKIRNALALSGLSVERDPWPSDAEVTGLRDVEWFAAGGPAVNDSLLDVLLDCRSLDSLTIAYGSLSREKLKRIGEFSKLRVLALPGADIDDEITESWTDLTALLDVNLNDTRIGPGTIDRLSRIKPLRRLSLRRVALDQPSIDGLAEMRNLSQLILDGVTVPAEQVLKLLRLPELESLDISGTPFDESFVELVQQSRVKHLVLRGSAVEPEVLDKLLAAKPLLYIDLGTLPETVDSAVADDLRERAIKVQANFRRGWQSVFPASEPFDRERWDTAEGMRESAGKSASITLRMPASMGRINVDVFRPGRSSGNPATGDAMTVELGPAATIR